MENSVCAAKDENITHRALRKLKPSSNTFLDGFVIEASLQDPRRKPVEKFILETFRAKYSAELEAFAPTLIACVSDRGIQAAAGIRNASDSELFTETYLDASIQNVLAGLAKSPIDRAAIAEVVNLSSRGRGASVWLLREITLRLRHRKVDWVVFTATAEVRRLFDRIGLRLYPVGAADPERLGNQLRKWGSYYDNSPIVYACQVSDGVERVSFFK